MDSVLREGWEVRKLGDVCAFQNGFSFKSKTFKDEGTPVVRITNIQKEKLDLSKIVYINPKDYDNDLSKYEIKKGDLLIAMSGATTGKIGIHRTSEILLLNQRVGKFEPNPKLSKKYLFNFLSTKVEESLAISAGAAQPNLSTEQIKNFEIPLPPLEEQQKIVAILDEAFGAIDKAKANNELNLQNAKELFESYLQSVFEDRGEGWEEKTLGDACVILMGQSPKGNTYNTEGIGTPLINGPVEFGKEPFSKTKKTKFTTSPTKYCEKDDLILCVRGSTTGRINISGFRACIGRGVASIRYEENQFWLNYFILSSRQKIYDLGTGATFPNVSSTILKNITIPIPPIIEQQQIVKKLDTLSQQTKALEKIYKAKIHDLDELKKSILQKAFSGELL